MADGSGRFRPGAALVLELVRIELERIQFAWVIDVASLTALLPVFGPFLALVAACWLLYWMTDSEIWYVYLALMITRVFAT
ncbi:MAG TPA: hypothetical protein DCR55_16675 [Lentisphaeria bacterium]|nr:hypothetical protein [Lentisphaeria bacterium]